MPSERLDIIINERGARVVSKRIDKIGQSATETDVRVNVLKTALVALGGTLVLRKLTSLSDVYVRIRNRLKVVTTGHAQLNKVFNDLADSSTRTRSSFEDTVELYSRITLSTKALGLTSEETLKIVETLNKAVAISGATASEASGAIRQLTQAFARGQLRGQELNSVLEQLPIIATSIEESLGITRGGLLELAEQGKITSKVMIDAMTNAGDAIDAAFAKSIPTAAQSLQVFNDRLAVAVGELGRMTGISGGLSKSILILAKSLGFLIKTMAILTVTTAAALILKKSERAISIDLAIANLAQAESAAAVSAAHVIEAQTTLAVTGATQKLTVAKASLVTANAQVTASSLRLSTAQATQIGIVGRLKSSVQGLFLALRANPIGLIITLVVAVVAAFTIFRNDIKLTKDGVVSLGTVFVAVERTIGKFFRFFASLLPDSVKKLAQDIFSVFKNLDLSIENLLRFHVRAVDNIIKVFKLMVQTIGIIFIGMGTVMVNGFKRAFRGVQKVVQDSVNKIIRKLQETGLFGSGTKEISFKISTKPIESFESTVARTSAIISDFTREAFNPKNIGPFETALDFVFLKLRQISAELEGQAKIDAIDKQREAVGAFLRIISKESELLRASAFERRELIAVKKIEEQSNIKLTESSLAFIQAGLKQQAINKSLGETLTRLNDPLRQTKIDMIALNAAFDTGKISVEQFEDALINLQLKTLEGDKSGLAGLKIGLLDLLKQFKDVASGVAKIVGNLFQGLEDQIVNFVKTGEINFKQLFASLAEDIIRVTIRAILFKTIISGLLTALGAGASAASSSANTVSTAAGTLGAGSGGISTGATTQGIFNPSGTARIFDTAPTGFAGGGFVTGPGSSTSDSVNASLSNGEFVINAAATRIFRPLLESINNGQSFNMSSSINRTKTSSSGTASNKNGGGNVTVNVINNSGVDVQIESVQEDDETKINIFLQKVDERLAADFSQNRGLLTEQIKGTQKEGF